MILELLQTDSNFVYTFLRVIAGIIIFPYGMQKLLGWYDDFGGGNGIQESLKSFAEKKVPKVIAWLVIIGQSFGSIALVLGFFGRVAAITNVIIFSGAIFFHTADGWTMNWNGKKKGEGIEYFIMLVSMLLVIAIKGSGAISMDHWLLNILT